jgi:hypothetical protein
MNYPVLQLYELGGDIACPVDASVFKSLVREKAIAAAPLGSNSRSSRRRRRRTTRAMRAKIKVNGR